MKTEDLKAKGLTQEQIDFVMAENGKDVTAAQGNLETVKAEKVTLETEKTEQAKQIAGYEKQLKDLKASAGDNEDLKKQIESLQEQNKNDKKASDEKIAQMAKEHAIETEIMASGALNSKAVKALIDAAKVTVDDKGTTGLKEQIDALKAAEDSKFLFKSNDPVIPEGTKPGQAMDTPEDATMQSQIDAAMANV